MADIWMDVDAALAEVPINIAPLTDDTDFKSKKESVVFNQAGLDLVWNFVTPAGAMTQTVVTPTESAGNYDWSNQGNGFYAIEIPASGGASINNDTEGFGWFSGVANGILPWRGPVIGFRAAGLNDKLIESVYSTTRGLAGTAMPDAAADAAGGLPISDAGGLDLDARLDAAMSSRSSHSAADVWAAGTRTLTAFDSAFKTGYALSSAGVQAIWDALTSALTTVGSIGKFIVDRIDAAITSRASQTTADADHDLTQANIAALNNLSAAQVASELATYDAPTKAELDAAVAPLALEATLTTIASYIDTEVALVLSRLGTPSDLGSGATVAANLADIEGFADNLPSDPADQSAVEAAITAAQAAILAKVLNYVQLILRKDAAIATDNAAEVAEINANEGSGAGAFANTTDAQEAIRDNMNVLSSAERNAIADAYLDRTDGVEAGVTPRQQSRVVLAAAGGKCDGAATTTMHYRDQADTKNRITATVDENGNRTAVTLDVS